MQSSPSCLRYSAISSAAASLWLVMRILIPSAWLALAAVCASGCANRTVFVPEESPMRVGPSSRLRVYHIIDGVWTLSENRIDIPEGWYLVPPSYVK